MSILFAFFKAVAAYLILMFLGTNLIGLIVRGFIKFPERDEFGNLIGMKKASSTGIAFAAIAILISIGYLYALFHFFNIGTVIAGAMLLFSRIPDVIFEIENGAKINSANMPKKPIDVFCNIIYWLAFPLLWYSFYILAQNS